MFEFGVFLSPVSIPRLKSLIYPTILPTAGETIVVLSQRVLEQCEIQTLIQDLNFGSCVHFLLVTIIPLVLTSVHTIVWLHLLESNGMLGRKVILGATQECCFKEILEAVPHKTAVVQVFTFHHAKHSSKKTWWKSKVEVITFSYGSYTWIHQCWPTSRDLHQFSTNSRCHLKDLPRMITDKDKQRESRELEL